MHDIWNPWHGCQKISEGCQNCYMYTLDKNRGGADSSVVKKTGGFYYPLAKNRDGSYKIKSGKLIRVCMTSDFFAEGADKWRDEVWYTIGAQLVKPLNKNRLFLAISENTRNVRIESINSFAFLLHFNYDRITINCTLNGEKI